MPTPEQMSQISLVVSIVSLVVAGGSLWYTRAQHRKRLADEMPIFWAEAEWIDERRPAIVLAVRNRAAADLVITEVAITRPHGLKLVAYDNAGAWSQEGRWEIRPDLIASRAARNAAAAIAARPIGTASQLQAGALVYGDEARGSFLLHRPDRPNLDSSRAISVSLRVIWSFKAAQSRKMTAHVYIVLQAAMNAAAAETKAAIT